GLYAEFVYTVAGVSHTVRRFFDIVLVKWPDVILPAYEFRDQVGGRMSKRELQSIDLAGFDFEDEIARATRDVRADILRMAYRPDLFMSFDAFKVPVAMRVLANWAEDGTNIPSSWKDLGADEYYNHRVAIYKEELKTALTNTRSYDPDQSGTVNQSERTARLGSTRISL
ncbi:MAG: hypothetical protein CMK74_00990, partial [Pseudomonadales bacterium]|nr:hypothetical protein [Pseudomonadales bacterium]